MTYPRFALMIAVSTLVMYGLMYLNTYALEHVFYSETRAWMALVMGAAMAFVMMGLMFGMYPNRRVNALIMLGAAVVFGVSLALVRSQITVSGPSYMRAMIPHHSIAVMTSTRADIQDERVRHLADDIDGAQQKEIAEMRWLIHDIETNGPTDTAYAGPAPRVGTLSDALANTLKSTLDPAPLDIAQARQVLGDEPLCSFARTQQATPIFYWAEDGAAVAQLNGVILPLDGPAPRFATGDGMVMTLDAAGTASDWRGDTTLTFDLKDGPSTGYIGFSRCDG